MILCLSAGSVQRIEPKDRCGRWRALRHWRQSGKKWQGGTCLCLFIWFICGFSSAFTICMCSVLLNDNKWRSCSIIVIVHVQYYDYYLPLTCMVKYRSPERQVKKYFFLGSSFYPLSTKMDDFFFLLGSFFVCFIHENK